jgi:hypothetical protein
MIGGSTVEHSNICKYKIERNLSKLLNYIYLYKIALTMQLLHFVSDNGIHHMYLTIHNIVFKHPVALTYYLVLCGC